MLLKIDVTLFNLHVTITTKMTDALHCCP